MFLEPGVVAELKFEGKICFVYPNNEIQVLRVEPSSSWFPFILPGFKEFLQHTHRFSPSAPTWTSKIILPSVKV